MKKNTTELVFVIDKSGSMAHLTDDTIGGFNAMIDKQKKEDGECLVSTVLFNSESDVIHDRVDIREVEHITDKEYCAGGCTALIDALGGAIHHIGNVHKYIRNEDVPEHTMFVITTDGMENASHKYSADKVKKMVKRQEEEYGWEFIFIGANIDSVETAKAYGIKADRAVDYHADAMGTTVLYEAVCDSVTHLRKKGKMSESWAQKIHEDYKSRK